jgi:aspartate carbamoyltransferase catalytic subunit
MNPPAADPKVLAAQRPRHLLTLNGLGREHILALIDRAAALRARYREGRLEPLLAGRTVMNLFFEASTRTRTSFELAAKRLGAHVVNFDIASSSTAKGESLEDTLATLEAMDADAFVVRHKDNGMPARLAAHARRAAIVNAGEGNQAHPTQGLLDLRTILDHRSDTKSLNVTICGDVRHSRVARSDIHGLSALGVREIRLCGPLTLLPDPDEFPDCRLVESFDDALDGSDVVIMLRLQKERMHSALGLGETEYFAAYGLTPERIRRAHADALVMHPGPMNRGVEITDEVADGSQSVILEQVANGIFVRMAVLAELIGV